jgi:hypothetical protein
MGSSLGKKKVYRRNMARRPSPKPHERRFDDEYNNDSKQIFNIFL